MRVPRDCHLIGRAVHQLPPRQLFHQVWIGLIAFHQLNAMGKPIAVALDLGKLGLTHAQPGLRVFKLEKTAFTPNGVEAEIGNHRDREGRKDQSPKETADGTLDSHSPNESHTDSARQERFS
jgi:hypothetical protein